MDDKAENNGIMETQNNMDKSKKNRVQRRPTPAETYGTIIFMFLAICGGYIILKWDLKIMILLCMAFNVFMGWRCGVSFKAMEKAIGDRIGSMGFFMLVILGIGFLVAACLCSGTIPVLVAWLGNLIVAKYILVLCLILPCILAAAIGSSFATLGTLGFIMFSLATLYGIPAGMAAAACICGANFGQYISPLADLPNLAASVNNISIQEYVKGYSVPFGISLLLSVVYFLIVGQRATEVNAAGTESVNQIIGFIGDHFVMSPLILLPFAVAIILALVKAHAVVMIYGTGVTALILGFTLQGFSLTECINAAYNGFYAVNMLPGTEVPEVLSSLLNRGGMYSMADGIVFFIIMLACVALLDVMGVFEVMKETVFKNTIRPGILSLKATLCGILFGMVACDPYTTVILTSEVIRGPIMEAGLHPKKAAFIAMSAGQLTGYLAPWSFLAVYMGAICGISPIDYIPNAVLFMLVPLVIVIMSFIGLGNTKLTADYKQGAQ